MEETRSENAPHVPLDSSTGLTCLSCLVVFARGDLQREHYKTDWHRYNLKRRSVELPPLNAEQFAKKADHFSSQQDNDGGEKRGNYCASCGKEFHSTKAFDNHLLSKRHREKGTNRDARDEPRKETKEQGVLREEEEQWSDVSSSEDELNEADAIAPNHCLFCDVPEFTSPDACLAHMSKSHGFTIPDREFCIDLDGLLHYLGLKVGSGHQCLWCNERRRFRSLDACRKHMRDSAHCRIAHESADLLELADFYDYGGVDDGSEESGVPVDMLDGNGWQLVLPSGRGREIEESFPGAVIGHRSLMRYYKQHLRPVDSNAPTGRTTRALALQRGSGTVAVAGPAVAQKARDLRFMKRLMASKQLKLGLKANKLFQFRGREE